MKNIHIPNFRDLEKMPSGTPPTKKLTYKQMEQKIKKLEEDLFYTKKELAFLNNLHYC